MTNSKVLFKELIATVKLEESYTEKKSIMYRLFEGVLGVSPTDIAIEKPVELSHRQTGELHQLIERINREEPVQYVLGRGDFYGRTFKLSSRVLIPRPETEGLVETALTDLRRRLRRRVLDIGTGSGCIAITLALELPGVDAFATDISLDALAVSRENAAQLNAKVAFARSDILEDGLPFGQLDLIVSNPPYVTPGEAGTMSRNVLNYEPRLALFTPADDPLLFYKAILTRSHGALKPGGRVIVEINEHCGEEVADLFLAHRFSGVEIIKDFNNKNRIVHGIGS